MRSYRPTYHASIQSGWSNDPNGTIFYNGKAHLFFQHYPHKAEWGTMHWGHFTTEDFIKWESLPVALVPDREYEEICGCCSGSTIERDGDLWLMYTAAQPERQRQCLAVSRDGGIRFVKNQDNPILTSAMLSPEVTETDCRDPRLFRKDGFFYMIAGARVLTREELEAACAAAPVPASGLGRGVRSLSAGSLPAPESDKEVRSPSEEPVSGAGEQEKAGYGNLILARSKDLLHWEYIGHLLDEETEGQIPMEREYFCLNGVYECPDYICLDGKEVILSSPQNLPQIGLYYQNVHSAIYLIGELDFKDGRFRVDKIGEIDSGFDFYAAQTLRMPDGRVIMIAWKEMWERNFPTRKEGWAGTYILPRELRVEGECLIQKPVREIERYRRNRVTADPFETADCSLSVEGVGGGTVELQVILEPGTAAQAGLKLFCGSGHETLVYYDRGAGEMVFDRTRSGLPFSGLEKDVHRRVCSIGKTDSIELQLFLDISSIEVFIDGGRHAMTGNVYPDPDRDTGIRFFAKGGACIFRDLVKYDIVV